MSRGERSDGGRGERDVSRRKLASALAAAGLNERAIAAEVLLMLPDGFVREYEALYHQTWGLVRKGDGIEGESEDETRIGEDAARLARGLKVRRSRKGGSGNGRSGEGVSEENGVRVGSVDPAVTGAGRRGSRIKDRPSGRISGYRPINERALRIKSRIDRKLRKLAGEMKDERMGLSRRAIEIGTEEIRVRCDACGRFVEDQWMHCAWCGAIVTKGKK